MPCPGCSESEGECPNDIQGPSTIDPERERKTESDMSDTFDIWNCEICGRNNINIEQDKCPVCHQRGKKTKIRSAKPVTPATPEPLTMKLIRQGLTMTDDGTLQNICPIKGSFGLNAPQPERGLIPRKPTRARPMPSDSPRPIPKTRAEHPSEKDMRNRREMERGTILEYLQSKGSKGSLKRRKRKRTKKKKKTKKKKTKRK